MIKLKLISLGCAKNLVDGERMLSALKQAGICLTEALEEAEVAVVNTCGFIESAKQEAIETILETAQYKKTGRLKALIATGCLTQRYREEFQKELPEVDGVLGTGSYESIVDAVRETLAGRRYAAFGDKDCAPLEGGRILSTPPYTAYLKIAEGCDNHCAYCVIPSLRGRYRSRRLEDILEEARGLCAAGVRELIVVAQDITRYGTDRYQKPMLPELLRELCRLDVRWVRLHYLYPDEIDDALVSVIAEEPKIVNYLDIPIQHISDRLLRRMHRRGGKAEITQLFRTLRERIPGLVLRTSLIVGLPGETEEEFAELCGFLQEASVERAGVFCYSAEEGTEAAEMPGQVEEETKRRRRFIAEEIQTAVIDEYNLSCMHKVFEVLCEGYDSEEQAYVGRTYADSPEIDGKVYFQSDREHAPGEFVMVRIDDSAGVDLLGAALCETERGTV